MTRHLIILTFLLISINTFGQKTKTVCKKVKGQKSKIVDNKLVGVMDTVLFSLNGKVIKDKNAEDENGLKGINVILKNIADGKVIGDSTNELGEFQIWGGEGTYDLEISYIGLDKIILKKVKFRSGELRQLNAVLGLGTYFIMVDK